MLLKIEDFMIPCLNKQLFGLECLGCGFQRSFIFLLKGDFIEAFKMYPAIFTLIMLALFLLIKARFQIKNSKEIIVTLAVVNILIILINYGIKMKFIFNI